MPIIKRYPNRKLYDTEAKQYITLDGIADLIRQGAEVQIIDHTTGEDLTAVTLTQIIFEQEKKQSGFLPKSILTGLVRAGGDTLNTLRRGLIPSLDLLRHIDEEIERRIQTLVNQGELAKEEGRRLRHKLLSADAPGSDESGTGEQMLERILRKHGIPTHDELDQLMRELEALSDKLDSLIEETETESAP
jgi:polyhydroxyalkanoate synthesis repressor PhaR